METVLRDCFWCGESYEMGKNERCPRCSTDVDTKAIWIIESSATDGENETTSSTN